MRAAARGGSVGAAMALYRGAGRGEGEAGVAAFWCNW